MNKDTESITRLQPKPKMKKNPSRRTAGPQAPIIPYYIGDSVWAETTGDGAVKLTAGHSIIYLEGWALSGLIHYVHQAELLSVAAAINKRMDAIESKIQTVKLK